MKRTSFPLALVAATCVVLAGCEQCSKKEEAPKAADTTAAVTDPNAAANLTALQLQQHQQMLQLKQLHRQTLPLRLQRQHRRRHQPKLLLQHQQQTIQQAAPPCKSPMLKSARALRQPKAKKSRSTTLGPYLTARSSTVTKTAVHHLVLYSARVWSSPAGIKALKE